MFGRHAMYSKKATYKFLDFIEEYKPDLINIHSLYGYFINLPIFLTYLIEKKIPVILTMHSCWDITGHCCYFDYINCNKWEKGCKNCEQIRTYPQSIFFDNVKKNYRIKKELYTKLNCMIVTPSIWLENIVRRSFLKQKRIMTIHNGIDIENFSFCEDIEKIKYHKKKIILGVAGVWSKRKGFEDFLELSKVLPDDILIILIGVNKKQLRKLPDNIIGVARTESINELATYYSIADILFNPTYEDNYPTVNLEAIACGTPYVTYDTGGSTELINKFECGKIVSKKNYEEVIRYVYELSKIELNELIFLREYIAKERMGADYIKLFRQFE